MSTSLYVSSAGASARIRELEITANNLANSSTEGFRADIATFRAALTASLRAPERGAGPAPIHVFAGTAGQATRHGAGGFVRTGAPLDAAIDGEGFFSVQTPEGVAYTRAGHFQVDRTGLLVTEQGHAVLGAGGPISIGAQPARIQPDGQIVDAGGAPLGQLSVVRFEDPGELTKGAENLFRAPALARRVPADGAGVIPGGVEGSNVNPMSELAQLVSLQRAFDASMQALEADDSASRRLIQEVAR